MLLLGIYNIDPEQKGKVGDPVGARNRSESGKLRRWPPSVDAEGFEDRKRLVEGEFLGLETYLNSS